jgi:hypothetical protein
MTTTDKADSLTARVTRLGWEGGFALETGKTQSQEHAKKRAAYPKSGARIVGRTHGMQDSMFLSVYIASWTVKFYFRLL